MREREKTHKCVRARGKTVCECWGKTQCVSAGGRHSVCEVKGDDTIRE